MSTATKTPKITLFIVVAFITGYVISNLLSIFYGEEDPAATIEEKCEEDKNILVEVTGAVVSPGVYELKKGARIIDLVKAAGDFTSDYDYYWVSKNINLSQMLKDEQKVFIPSEILGYGEAVKGSSISIFSIPSVSSDVAGQSSSSSSAVSGSADDSNKVNVNEATFDELDSLPGIGEVYAGKIMANRPYSGAEEFKQKSGLSNSVYDKIKDLISF